MNSNVLIITVLLSLLGTSYTSPLKRNVNNNINDDNSVIEQRENNAIFEAKDWIKISEAPPTHITKPIGSTIILECEATGTPTPQIKWIRGNGGISNIEDLIEDNMISEASPDTLVRVKSRLVIDHVSSSDRTYTCLARAGGQYTYASTIVSSSKTQSHNYTDILSLSSNLMKGPKEPTIVYFYSVVLETTGSNIILPCQTVGRPRPDIYWLDANDNIINGQDHRFKVLSHGNLLISGLRWSDMGAYTCVAKNAFAKDSITTFVYPLGNGQE